LGLPADGCSREDSFFSAVLGFLLIGLGSGSMALDSTFLYGFFGFYFSSDLFKISAILCEALTFSCFVNGLV